MNPTDVVTLANGILKENASLTIPRIVNAAIAFQNFDGNGVGTSQTRRKSNDALASETKLTRKYTRAL